MTSARKRPVFGDCEQEDGPFAEGDRTRDCSAFESGRTSSCTGSPESRPNDSADRSKRRGANITVFRGRPEPPRRLDRDGLLIEVLVPELLLPRSNRHPPVPSKVLWLP